MDDPSHMFSFAFSLFGLLLGLSLAAVLTGFARALRMRPRIKMGLLSPLLGLFVILDVTSFWNGAWRAQAWIEPDYGHLFVGLVITSIYYVAASAVFPEGGETVADYDRHYFETRRWILLPIGACNLAVFGWLDFRHVGEMPLSWWIAFPAYFTFVITAAVTHRRGLSLACLSGLVSIYVYLTIWTLAT